MNDTMNDYERRFPISETEQKVRYGIGSAAAAAAIYAPLNYYWKGALTAVAAVTILSAIYGFSPAKALMNA